MAWREDPGAPDATASSPPPPQGLPRIFGVLTVVFFVALFFSLTIPTYDPDYWWHLASGRWMWEHRALPQADPFDFTSEVFGTSRYPAFMLTQYWLAQLVLYAAFLLAGIKGIVLVRAAVFTGLFFCLFRLVRRTGAGVLLSMSLVALAVRVVVDELAYFADRPQMWSSLFFTVLLLLLENLREGRRWAAFALPPFMLLWANLHGGYILGIIVIVVAAATNFFSRHGEGKRMLLVGFIAIALSGCNPAGFEVLLSYPLARLSTSAAVLSSIQEELPLFRYVSVSALPGSMPGLTAVFLLPFLTLGLRLKSLPRERRDTFLIYLLTLVLGLKAQRYLIFLVPTACWITALNLAAARTGLRAACQWSLFRRPPAWATGLATAAVLVSLSVSYALKARSLSLLKSSATYRHGVENAADFLKRSKVRGNLLNEYGMGGYLAWRLSPDLKIFIYGRMVYPELLTLYDEVMYRPGKTVSLTPTGNVSYFYNEVLDKYAIDAVIIPAGDLRNGNIIPLSLALVWDRDWALVHAEPKALVFLRKIPAFAPLLERALPKSAIFDNIIALASAIAGMGHGQSPIWRRSLAIAYDLKGQKVEALRILDDYLRLAPGDPGDIALRKRIALEISAGKR